MKKILLVVVALLVLGASPAAAQYGEDFSATLSATDVRPGETVVVDGSCTVGESVTVALGATTLGSTAVRSNGTYSVSVTIPEVGTGTHTLSVSCGDQVRQLSFTVGGSGASPSPAAAPESLARTGSSTGALVRVGGVLLLAGAVMIAAVRQRGRSGITA